MNTVMTNQTEHSFRPLLKVDLYTLSIVCLSLLSAVAIITGILAV